MTRLASERFQLVFSMPSLGVPSGAPFFLFAMITLEKPAPKEKTATKYKIRPIPYESMARRAETLENARIARLKDRIESAKGRASSITPSKNKPRRVRKPSRPAPVQSPRLPKKAAPVKPKIRPAQPPSPALPRKVGVPGAKAGGIVALAQVLFPRQTTPAAVPGFQYSPSAPAIIPQPGINPITGSRFGEPPTVVRSEQNGEGSFPRDTGHQHGKCPHRYDNRTGRYHGKTGQFISFPSARRSSKKCTRKAQKPRKGTLETIKDWLS